MKYLAILTTALLLGCSTTVPVVAKFPKVPLELTQHCPPLKKLEGDQVNIVDLHTRVVENYTQYYECSVKVEEWNTWYVQQKKIFEEIK